MDLGIQMDVVVVLFLVQVVVFGLVFENEFFGVIISVEVFYLDLGFEFFGGVMGEFGLLGFEVYQLVCNGRVLEELVEEEVLEVEVVFEKYIWWKMWLFVWLVFKVKFEKVEEEEQEVYEVFVLGDDKEVGLVEVFVEVVSGGCEVLV